MLFAGHASSLHREVEVTENDAPAHVCQEDVAWLGVGKGQKIDTELIPGHPKFLEH